MRVYNSFIVTLALAFGLITVVLAAYGADKLDLYYALYTITLLILTVLYIYFSPKARRALNLVGVVAFAGFLVVVALKVMEILLK
jgi:peptidoglycan/LPS O-acetylase OafA/YrhL